MHAPFHQPRNVERRGMDATFHVESRVSRDTDIFSYRRYGVHNNAVLDSYVYYDPIESTWFYRDRKERVNQDFLDDYFSDRKEELNYRGIYHPRVKFLNGQWVPNEIAAPSATVQESSTTLDSQFNMSNDVRVRERHTHRASKTTMEYAHENTSSHPKMSRRHRSSAARHEAPSSSSGRSMFEVMAKFFDEYPRRKTGGRHLSSMHMHEAPMWGRDETTVERMAHLAVNEDRRDDLARSRTAVVHRTTEPEATELQQQLLPKQHQPASSTMHSTDDAGLKGRTTAPDVTQSHQPTYQEGYKSRTLTDVQETKSKEVEHAAQLPQRESPESSIADRREDSVLKGRETVPAARNRRIDVETSTRRKAELNVQPQHDVPLHNAAIESTTLYVSQSNAEDRGEGMRVSHDTLRRARDEGSPRHEEPRRRGDEGCRLHKTGKDVVSGRRGSNDSDDEDRRWRALQSRGDESRRLRAEVGELVIGREVEQAAARECEYRRSTERTMNDERSRRERRKGKRDESARFSEAFENLVVERGSDWTGMASDERHAGYNPASLDGVEGGGENVPVKPGHLAQDGEDGRYEEQRAGDESARLQEGTMPLVVERVSGSGMTSMLQTSEKADENTRRQILEEKGDEGHRLHETRNDVVSERRTSNDSDDEGSRRRKLYPGEDEDHRLHESRQDVVSGRRGSNDSDDEDVHRRTLRPRSGENRHLHDMLEDLVVGRGVGRAGASSNEPCRTTEQVTNDERNRRVVEDGRRDENVRLLETSEYLVVERGSEAAGMASREAGAGYNPAAGRSGERMVGNVPTLTSRNGGARGSGFALVENDVSAAWMADLPPSQTILEGDVPRNPSPARSKARSNPSPGYSLPQPSHHPPASDHGDRRRSMRADESIAYSRHRERLKEGVSEETRHIVSSQYSNASIGVYSPDTRGSRPQVHDYGLLQPPVTSSIVENVDGRGRNECSRERDVAVQRRGACDTSHTQSRYVGPTRASLAASDAYWAKYSPSRAAGGKISPPATTEENEELEDVDDNNSSEAGYNSG